MRSAILAACVVGWVAGCQDQSHLQPCNVDQYTANADTTTEDCGTYSRGSANYTDAAMNSAQLCVLNAIKANRGFHLTYDPDPLSGAIDPTLRAGFTGTLVGGTLHFRAYAGKQANDMASAGDSVSARDCTGITATPSCKPVVGLPCLDCDGDAIGQIACRG